MPTSGKHYKTAPSEGFGLPYSSPVNATSQFHPRVYIGESYHLTRRWRMDITQYLGDSLEITRVLMGGNWTASMRLTSNQPQKLKSLFQRILNAEIKVKIGATPIWHGYINEVDISISGVTRRRSLSDVSNCIKCAYTNADTDEREETTWFENAQSISFYGRREDIVNLDKVVPATADAYAQRILSENQYPQTNIVDVSMNDSSDTELYIKANGFVFTANNRYLTLSPGKYDIRTAIVNTISNDIEFLSSGGITPNAVVIGAPDNDIRAWDFIEGLAEIGDEEFTRTVLTVYNDYKIRYTQMPYKPSFFWDGSRLTTSTGTSLGNNKWNIYPGVLRDRTWGTGGTPGASRFQDSRDVVVDKVTISARDPIPNLSTVHYEDSELIHQRHSIRLPKWEPGEGWIY